MTSMNAQHRNSNHKPFRGFLASLLSEAFYTEEFIPAAMTEPENLSIYDYEDPCDQQHFLRSFLGKAV